VKRLISRLLVVVTLAFFSSGCWYLESQVKPEKKPSFHDYTQEQFAQLPKEEQHRLWHEFDQEMTELERKVGMN